MRWITMWSLLLLGCQSRHAGMAGDPCGPARACAAGLTCQQSLCTPLCDMSNGWVQMPSGTSSNLRAVWGSSANAVWAVGDGGTAVFYDGQKWQPFAIPAARGQAPDLVAVHGSSPSNVYAVGNLALSALSVEVLQFSGQQWQPVGAISEFGEATGVYVTGDDAGDVYATTRRKDGTFLFRYNGTTRSSLATSSSDAGASCAYIGKPNTGVWAYQAQPNRPPSAVFIADCQTWQWDSKLGASPLRGPNPVQSNNLWGALSTDQNGSLLLFTLESADMGGNPYVSTWNGGGPLWSIIDTRFNGWTGGVSGTAVNRVFVTGNDGNQSYVFQYDGTSVSQDVMPSGVTGLLGVWAAPTGEVFAVGANGAIVMKH